MVLIRLFGAEASAQTAMIDSLKGELEKAEVDTVKAKYFRLISQTFARQYNFDSALHYVNQAILIHRNNNQQIQLGQELSNLSRIYNYKGNPIEGIEALLEAEKIFTSSKSLSKDERIILSKVYSNFADAYTMIGIRDSQNIGKIENYTFKSLKIKREIGSDLSVAIGLQNLSSHYLNINEYQKAIDTASLSCDIYASVNDYLGVGDTKGIQAIAYQKLNQLDKAIKLCQESIEPLEKANRPDRLAQTAITIASIKISQKKFQEAVNVIEEFIPFADSTKNFLLLRDLNYELSTIHNASSDYKKAFDYFKVFVSYRDSINDQNARVRIENLQTQFETEKKDLQISKQQLELEQEQQAKERLSIIIGLISLLLLVAIASVYFVNKAKKKEKIAKENANRLAGEISLYASKMEQKNKEISELKSNLEHELSNELAKVRELKFSREDFVSEQAYRHHTQKVQAVDEFLSYRLAVGKGIDPKEAFMGLVEKVVVRYTELSEKSNNPIDYSYKFSFPEKMIIENVKLELVASLVEELCRNAQKHAFPTQEEREVALTVSEENNRLAISYQDNGVGIAGEHKLRAIESTVATLGGSVEYGANEEGTAIDIKDLKVLS